MSELRNARKRLGLTVYDVSERARVSPGFVSKLERGLIGVSAATAKRIAVVLEMDPADVVFPDRNADTA